MTQIRLHDTKFVFCVNAPLANFRPAYIHLAEWLFMIRKYTNLT
jgi:hypothetical protein